MKNPLHPFPLRVALLATLLSFAYGGTCAINAQENTQEIKFELVTNVNQLEEGGTVTLVDHAQGLALGSKASNNFKAVNVTISNDEFTYDSNAGITLLTLEKSSNFFYFRVSDNKYLCSTSSSSNNMGTDSRDNAAKAKVSISSTGLATITFQDKEKSRNTIRSNYSSSLFSCYDSSSSTGNAPSIYKRVKSANVITTPTEYVLDLTKDEKELTLSATSSATDGDVTYAIKSSTLKPDDDFSFDTETGKLVVYDDVSPGMIVITASCAETLLYKAAEPVDITIYIAGASKSDPTLVVSDTEITFGENLDIDTQDFACGAVSLDTSNPSIATVNNETLTIIPVAVGEVTITVNSEENFVFNAGSKTFTLTVKAPAGKDKVSTLFYESFDQCAGADGFSGKAGNGTFIADNSGWYAPYAHGADKSAKFGTDVSKSSATTPPIPATSGATYLLSFKAAPWNTESTNMLVTAEGADIEGISTSPMKTEEWNLFTATITATSPSFTLEFSASKFRFFLDEVMITEPESVTLNDKGYATYCSVNPLDFTDAEEAGYSAWQIKNIASDGTLTFEQITGGIKGGQGVFLKGAGGSTISMPLKDSAVELEDNLLVGTTAPQYFGTAGSIYGLKSESFVPNSIGSIRANRAYLPSEVIPEEVKQLRFVYIDPTTGIRNVETVDKEEARRIFDLSGHRLSSPMRGVNIINGHKVFIQQ